MPDRLLYLKFTIPPWKHDHYLIISGFAIGITVGITIGGLIFGFIR